MSLLYSRFHYGWTVTTGTNDKLDFIDAGTTYAATLNAGTYTPGAFAAEVQRAMQAITGNTHNLVSYAPVTMLFTLTGTATFSLLFGTGTNNATSCGGLLGFTTGGGAGNDKTGSTSYSSTATPGTAAPTSSAATAWTLVEPHVYVSPCTAVAEVAPSGSTGQAGSTATFTQRQVLASQKLSDGGTPYTAYQATVKAVTIEFGQLLNTGSPSEITNMERFLDWIVQGRPFAWQPDKTATGLVRLVADLTTAMNVKNDFAWLTRGELSYGRISFLEVLTA